VHAEPGDLDAVAAVLPVLLEKSGRLIWNGFPTGVSVTGAMNHGGPYPASTFPGHTSVGWTAIRRFLRPVTFQDVPEELLPMALRDGNPLNIVRLVTGRHSAQPVDPAGG
jgi:NADP-dependent aldehyde dehydrogenase